MEKLYLKLKNLIIKISNNPFDEKNIIFDDKNNKCKHNFNKEEKMI